MLPTIILSLFFPCRNFCAENFVLLFYEIKLLFTYFTYLKKFTTLLEPVPLPVFKSVGFPNEHCTKHTSLTDANINYDVKEL